MEIWILVPILIAALYGGDWIWRKFDSWKRVRWIEKRLAPYRKEQA